MSINVKVGLVVMSDLENSALIKSPDTWLGLFLTSALSI